MTKRKPKELPIPMPPPRKPQPGRILANAEPRRKLPSKSKPRPGRARTPDPEPPKRVHRPRTPRPENAIDAPTDVWVRQNGTTQALVYTFMRFLQRPEATVETIWEQENSGPSPESPPIRTLMTLEAFKTQAHKNSWVERRKTHWVDIQERVSQQIKDQAVQAELDEIQMLNDIRVRAHLFVFGGMDKDGNVIEPVKPKTLEGLLSALVALDKRTSEKRERVTGKIAAAAQPNPPSPPSAGQPSISPALISSDTTFDEATIQAIAEAVAEGHAKSSKATMQALKAKDEPKQIVDVQAAPPLAEQLQAAVEATIEPKAPG